MASYQDYVNKRDNQSVNLEKELEDAQADSLARREGPDNGFKMPEQFANKSPEEIAQSYLELQKMNSRQAQDLGQMRQLADSLLALQSQTKGDSPEPEEDPVTTDDLWDDPESVIRRVAERGVSPKLEALESRLSQYEQMMIKSELSSRHPDWEKTTAQPHFEEWIREKPYRQRLAIAASQNDFDAADELLTLYEDSQSISQQMAERDRKEQLRRAGGGIGSVSGSGGNPNHTETVYSRSELLQKRIEAQRGDDDAARWLASNAESIRHAYAEGRVTD